MGLKSQSGNVAVILAASFGIFSAFLASFSHQSAQVQSKHGIRKMDRTEGLYASEMVLLAKQTQLVKIVQEQSNYQGWLSQEGINSQTNRFQVAFQNGEEYQINSFSGNTPPSGLINYAVGNPTSILDTQKLDSNYTSIRRYSDGGLSIRAPQSSEGNSARIAMGPQRLCGESDFSNGSHSQTCLGNIYAIQPTCTVTASSNIVASGSTLNIQVNSNIPLSNGTLTTSAGSLSSSTIATTPQTILATAPTIAFGSPNLNVNYTANFTYDGSPITCSVAITTNTPPVPLATCSLNIMTSPSIRLGQTVQLGLWINSGWPTSARISKVLALPNPAQETALNVNIPIGVWTAIVTPPMGQPGTYQVVYEAEVTNAAGSTTCRSAPISICPLNTPIYSNLKHMNPPPGFPTYCTNCDHWQSPSGVGGQYVNEGVVYYGRTTNDLPGLVPIYTWYSALKDDHWTARAGSNPPGGQGYVMNPTPTFYAFGSQSDAPNSNLQAEYLWHRQAPNGSFPYAGQQDTLSNWCENHLVFPACKTMLFDLGFTRVNSQFFACPAP